jgi:hypothetical protein
VYPMLSLIITLDIMVTWQHNYANFPLVKQEFCSSTYITVEWGGVQFSQYVMLTQHYYYSLYSALQT